MGCQTGVLQMPATRNTRWQWRPGQGTQRVPSRRAAASGADPNAGGFVDFVAKHGNRRASAPHNLARAECGSPGRSKRGAKSAFGKPLCAGPRGWTEC